MIELLNGVTLIVDDSSLARDSLRDALAQAGGRNFLEAESGHEAIEVLRRQVAVGLPVRLVTCDIKMPGISGIDFLRELRAIPVFENLPVIMVTVELEVKLIRDALGLGAIDYIVKPFTAKIIQQKLNKLSAELKKSA